MSMLRKEFKKPRTEHGNKLSRKREEIYVRKVAMFLGVVVVD